MEQDKEFKALNDILAKRSSLKAPAGMSDEIISTYLADENSLSSAPALIPVKFWFWCFAGMGTLTAVLLRTDPAPSPDSAYHLKLDAFLDGFISLFARSSPVMVMSLGIFAFMMLMSVLVITRQTEKGWA